MEGTRGGNVKGWKCEITPEGIACPGFIPLSPPFRP